MSPVGCSAVHPELLCREAKGHKIQESCNPTVLCILNIALVHVCPELLHAGVLLLQVDVLDESHASDVEEDPHEGELEDPPGGDHYSAQ